MGDKSQGYNKRKSTENKLYIELTLSMKRRLILFLVAATMFLTSVSASGDSDLFGWPEQKVPSSVIVCTLPRDLSERMMLESLSGLAAQGVNNGVFNEMIWISSGDSVYEKLYERTKQIVGIRHEREMELWQLLDYLHHKQIVKGYVLYRADTSIGHDYSDRLDMDFSSNVATVYGAVLGGVLIDENLQQQAIDAGLPLLKDCRGITPQQCFDDNRSRLNNISALCVDPRVENCRDFAIAHKTMVYYGTGQFTEQVLEWVQPLSPIVGWNCGGEDNHTGPVSRWGLFNTASNWCRNLPFLSSARGKVQLVKASEMSPENIDFTDSSTFHSFVMSDGDNMQWSMGRFTQSELYYGNPNRGLISWTTCPINLSLISPFTWNDIATGQNGVSSLIEYGGGYQYADQFAVNRPNREVLLTQFARRINLHMKQMGITVFGFICMDVRSAAAMEAYRIYAREIENLTGMMAVQYYPYELGGEIIWVDSARDADIPVVTARYSVWNSISYARPNAGSPEYVASLINRDALRTPADEDGKLAWTVAHVWSEFTPQNSSLPESVSGSNAVIASVEKLIPKVKNVSANELLWRIRMKYRPYQTIRLLEKHKQKKRTTK